MTRHEQAFALAAGAVAAVTWLTWWPTIRRAARARKEARQ